MTLERSSKLSVRGTTWDGGKVMRREKYQSGEERMLLEAYLPNSHIKIGSFGEKTVKETFKKKEN